MNHVEEAIKLWEIYRQGTIGELENIPEEHWEHRAGDGARSVREVALHIAVSAIGFTDALLSESGAFVQLRDPQMQAQMMAPYESASRAELLELLTSSGAENARRLRDAGEALAEQLMPSFGGQQSRLTGLWFAAAHEMYHRGQLATYARQLGIVPAMTKRTQSATIPPRR
jgi:uncharacterized damage-inducible protein DinB